MFNCFEGVRKFSVMIGVAILDTSLLLTHQINGDNWASVMGWSVVAFMGANGIEHGQKVINKLLEKK